MKQTLKKIIAAIAGFLLLYPVYGQKNKNADFEKTVKKIITAFKTNDNQTLNSYVHTNTGVYLLYRTGVYDNYKKMDRIVLGDTAEYPRFHAVNHLPAISTINTSKLPVYDCDNGKWSSYGTFSTTKIYHDLSNVCRSLNKYLYEGMDEKIPEKEIKQYIGLEYNSRKIICCKKVKEMDAEIIFHLIYINGKWYLWLVDDITTDCSA
jgi:Cu/Ag efflux pump CusA